VVKARGVSPPWPQVASELSSFRGIAPPRFKGIAVLPVFRYESLKGKNPVPVSGVACRPRPRIVALPTSAYDVQDARPARSMRSVSGSLFRVRKPVCCIFVNLPVRLRQKSNHIFNHRRIGGPTGGRVLIAGSTRQSPWAGGWGGVLSAHGVS